MGTVRTANQDHVHQDIDDAIAMGEVWSVRWAWLAINDYLDSIALWNNHLGKSGMHRSRWVFSVMTIHRMMARKAITSATSGPSPMVTLSQLHTQTKPSSRTPHANHLLPLSSVHGKLADSPPPCHPLRESPRWALSETKPYCKIPLARRTAKTCTGRSPRALKPVPTR